MNNRLSKPALTLLAEIPDTPVEASELPATAGPAGLRHLLRRLLDAGLLEATKRRPLTVRLANVDLVPSLRDHIRRNPHNARLLAGATLPILAVLAATADREGLAVEQIAREAAAHENTVRNSLRRLRHRGLIASPRPGRYALAEHAATERRLGKSYAKHRLQQRTPRGPDAIIDLTPLVRVLESENDLGLPLTAVSRFQAAGADVIARRVQMRIHAFREDQEPSLEEALEDARRLNTARNTLRRMEMFTHA